MSKHINIVDKNYLQWVKELSTRYRCAQIKAAVKVNSEMLHFYWELGRDIVSMKAETRWGSKFIHNLSKDLKNNNPDATCFSPTNLLYMKNFYLLYHAVIENTPQPGEQIREGAITPQLGEQMAEEIESALFSIPWGHHKLLIDKHKGDVEKALFFVQKTLENNWSRSMLSAFIDTDLYERSGKAITNFSLTLPAVESDAAKEILKDPYNFDFLALREDYKERDLQRALEQNISRFLLELGSGFAFVGRQVRLAVGEDEYFCDLLFYHIKLRRYIVCELKTVKFEPEFISKLNFYCTAVNHLIKGEDDHDTIGLLICKEKNDLVAQWTVEKNQQQPLGISSFELTKLYPKEVKDSLPTIEEIEEELNKK